MSVILKSLAALALVSGAGIIMLVQTLIAVQHGQ
jgi:hypothetical protein